MATAFRCVGCVVGLIALAGCHETDLYYEYYDDPPLLVFADKNGTCLEDGVPAHLRRSVGPPGRNLTMLLSRGSWTDNELLSRIQIIILREHFGIHVHVLQRWINLNSQYRAMAGCLDYLEKKVNCEKYSPHEPAAHFSSAFWATKLVLAQDSMKHVEDSEKYSRVVNLGVSGFTSSENLFIFKTVVDRAYIASNKTLSLDWYRDLQKKEAMQYFTPLRDMDISWGVYQYCDHNDAEYLRKWGYVCNQTYEYDNPWRKPVSGAWNESGSYPTRIRPLYNCSEFKSAYPLGYAGFADEGFVCRGEGWWLTPACVLISPGDEYLDLCIPTFEYNPNREDRSYFKGQQTLPLAYGCISIWGAFEEFVYDWAKGHVARKGLPNVALLVYWSPDATFRVLYDKLNGQSAHLAVVLFPPILGQPTNILQNIAHESIFQFAPQYASALQRIVVGQDEVNKLMESVVDLVLFGAAPNDFDNYTSPAVQLDYRVAHDEAACAWVRANRAEWESLLGAETCLANTYFNLSVGLCEPCPLGFVSPRGSPDIKACVSCPNGTGYEIGTGCVKCRPGFSRGGSALEMRKHSTCERCAIGHISAAGATTCDKCPVALTTQYRGSVSLKDCLCAQGSFRDSSDRNLCLPCSDGMSCDFGSDSRGLQEWSDNATSYESPRLRPGYFSMRESPLSVYLCEASNSKACAGGAPGSCFGARSGFVCARCPDGQAPGQVVNDDEDSLLCKVCSDLTKAVAAFLPFLGLGLLAASYYFGNNPVSSDSTVFLGASIVAGLMITDLQLLANLRKLPSQWPTFADQVFRSLQFLTLEPSTMSIECLIGQDPEVLFFFRFLVPYFVVIGMSFWYGVSVGIAAAFGNNIKWSLDKTINSTGQLYQAIFIVFANVASIPFQCYSHPNGMKSVVTYPDVICWESNHYALIAMGLVLVVTFLVPFLAISVWANWYAVRITRDSSYSWHLVRFRFLFYRFRPDVWWWGSVFLMRQLLLAFTPMVSGDDPHAQCAYVLCILVVYITAVCLFCPWKARMLNVLDIVSMLVLVFLMAAFASLMPRTRAPEDYSYLISLLLGLQGLVMFVFMAFVLWNIMTKGLKGEFGLRPKATDSLHLSWLSLCEECAGRGPKAMKDLVEYMNVYDRSVLLTAIGCVQASGDIHVTKVAPVRLMWIRNSEQALKGCTSEGAPGISSTAELSASKFASSAGNMKSELTDVVVEMERRCSGAVPGEPRNNDAQVESEVPAGIMTSQELAEAEVEARAARLEQLEQRALLAERDNERLQGIVADAHGRMALLSQSIQNLAVVSASSAQTQSDSQSLSSPWAHPLGDDVISY